MLKISRILEQYHAIFYKMWEIGEPIMDTSIPRACVVYKPLQFRFNPEFYNSLTDLQKAFVIAHECMHPLLNHDKRLREDTDLYIANQAKDIALHEILFKIFPEECKNIPGGICLRENMCPEALPDESAEYYYHYLIDNNICLPTPTLDLHIWDIPDSFKHTLQTLIDTLPEQEKVSMGEIVLKESDKKESGTDAGNRILSFKVKPKRKRKWETVIRDWLNVKEVDKEQWAIPHRRIENSLIPYEYPHEEKKKTDVIFFLDTSGSCEHLGERFFNAAKSLPESFNVHLYCFDTEVYKVEKELKGFGGTSFNILEDEVEKISKKMNHYPTIFVITDGYGNEIHCKRPNRWHWFLTEGGYRNYIPQECYVHWLKDYE